MRAINVARSPVIVHLDVASFRPTQALQRLAERCNARLCLRIALGKAHQHADPPHPAGLLPARRERPDGYTAAKKCDEFPPPHGAYPKAKDHEPIIARCVAQKACSQSLRLDAGVLNHLAPLLSFVGERAISAATSRQFELAYVRRLRCLLNAHTQELGPTLLSLTSL